MPDMKIISNKPQIEYNETLFNLFARRLGRKIKKFYEKPENLRAFEEWMAKNQKLEEEE